MSTTTWHPATVLLGIAMYEGLKALFRRAGRMGDPYRTDNRILDFVNDLPDESVPTLMRVIADRLEQQRKGRVAPLLLTPDEKAMVASGDKIGAIKAVRWRTSLGLKESKDLVDNYCAGRGG
jgi:hypothetical protein